MSWRKLECIWTQSCLWNLQTRLRHECWLGGFGPFSTQHTWEGGCCGKIGGRCITYVRPRNKSGTKILNMNIVHERSSVLSSIWNIYRKEFSPDLSSLASLLHFHFYDEESPNKFARWRTHCIECKTDVSKIWNNLFRMATTMKLLSVPWTF